MQYLIDKYAAVLRRKKGSDSYTCDKLIKSDTVLVSCFPPTFQTTNNNDNDMARLKRHIVGCQILMDGNVKPNTPG